MDLAAAKIAYDIQWNTPDKYSKLIIHLGAFHTMCSYMGAIGKMMTGSGFEEILIESGICASGSIVKVMSGKHYNRAMRVHQHMTDAVEGMILDSYFKSKGNEDSSVKSDICEKLLEMCNLSNSPSYIKICEVENNTECKNFIDDFNKYREEVRCGLLGKTAQFWVQYCDLVWVLMHCQRAVKENNLALYIYSLRRLCKILFSSDHVHYSRYLPLYYTQLLNLHATHRGAEHLLQNLGFSVARSDVPASRNPVDITIVQTINRSAKTRGGLIGMSCNVGAYYRWCLTRHKRATYVDAAFHHAFNMSTEGCDGHKTTRTSEIRKSDVDVI